MGEARRREAFRKALDAAVTPGVTERPPAAGVSYVAFFVHERQPSPGVLAIAHREGSNVVLDLVRENITVANSAAVLKRYGISSVTGALCEGDGLDLAHAALGALDLARAQ